MKSGINPHISINIQISSHIKQFPSLNRRHPVVFIKLIHQWQTQLYIYYIAITYVDQCYIINVEVCSPVIY